MSVSDAAAAAPAVPPVKVFVAVKVGKRQVVVKEDEVAFLKMVGAMLKKEVDNRLITWELIARADNDAYADPRQLVDLGRRLLKADLHALHSKDFETDEHGSAYDAFIDTNGGLNGALSEDQTVAVYVKARAEWTRLVSAYLNRPGGEAKTINLLEKMFFGFNPMTTASGKPLYARAESRNIYRVKRITMAPAAGGAAGEIVDILVAVPAGADAPGDGVLVARAMSPAEKYCALENAQYYAGAKTGSFKWALSEDYDALDDDSQIHTILKYGIRLNQGDTGIVHPEMQPAFDVPAGLKMRFSDKHQKPVDMVCMVSEAFPTLLQLDAVPAVVSNAAEGSDFELFPTHLSLTVPVPAFMKHIEGLTLGEGYTHITMRLTCGLNEVAILFLFKQLRLHARSIYNPAAQESKHPKNSYLLIKATLRRCLGSPRVVQWP
jgi:hypothetical protein